MSDKRYGRHFKFQYGRQDKHRCFHCFNSTVYGNVIMLNHLSIIMITGKLLHLKSTDGFVILSKAVEIWEIQRPKIPLYAKFNTFCRN